MKHSSQWKHWKVVGGMEHGGILVRQGRELNSRLEEQRLSTGANLEQIALVKERLNFRRLNGSGPETGWISINLAGKALAVRTVDNELVSEDFQQQHLPTAGVRESKPLQNKQQELSTRGVKASEQIQHKKQSVERRSRRTSVAQPPGRTIVFVFAGRHRYLSILVRYLQSALENKEIDEVHLWDMCFNWGDRMYLKSLGVLPGFEVMVTDDGKYGNWEPVYRYYADPSVLQANDVIIKCDDDVVYLRGLGKLANFTRERKERGLVYPNIVNNVIGAHWQLHNEMWKPADDVLTNPTISAVWYDRAEVDFDFWNDRPGKDPADEVDHGWAHSAVCAEAALGAFLQMPSRFTKNQVHEWRTPRRVSINCFAIRGRDAQEVFPDVPWGDEVFLSRDVMRLKSWSAAMLMSSVAVHFAFSKQRQDGLDKDGKILRSFSELAESELEF